VWQVRAGILDVSRATVYRMIKSESLSAVLITKGIQSVTDESIRRYLKLNQGGASEIGSQMGS